MTTPKIATKKDLQAYESLSKYDALYYEKAKKADAKIGFTLTL